MPYMVEVQSNLLQGLPTRLMVPLGIPALLPAAIPQNLCPRIDFGQERVYLLAHFASPFRVKEIGSPLGSVAAHASDIVAAMDAVLSGF